MSSKSASTSTSTSTTSTASSAITPLTPCLSPDGFVEHQDLTSPKVTVAEPETMGTTSRKGVSAFDPSSSKAWVRTLPAPKKNKKQLSLNIRTHIITPSSSLTQSPKRRHSASPLAPDRLDMASLRSIARVPPTPNSAAEEANIEEAEMTYKSGPVQIDDGLYLGNEENARDSRLLARLKVDRVLCVAKEVITTTNSEEYDDGVKRLKLPWGHDHPTVLDELPELVKFVEVDPIEEKSTGHRAALVHCALGISRSATVVIALVMQRHRWTFARAYDFVKSKAPWVGPNMSLVYQLCDLEGKMRAEGVYEECC